MKKIYVIVLAGVFSVKAAAQSQPSDRQYSSRELKFKYQALIIPSVLIGYGVVGLESHNLQDINTDTENELNEHIDRKITIDDFSQYSTFLSV